MERKTEVILSQNNKDNKRAELKKHVAVIHSSNKLTLLQRKIANALLFNAYKELEEKDEHMIQISKLCDIIGYDSNDHKSIKTALINLISTVLEWNLIDGERIDCDQVWNASSIIAGATIDGALCTYSYSPQMRKLLYRPNVYGRLDMLVQAKFQSTYGLALYENCNRFQDVGQTPWFTLPKFRKLMGVEEGKYKIFRDFKTRVLDKAVEEVNKYSPLSITHQFRRQNRQVFSIQFLIKKTKLNMFANIENNSLSHENVLSILKFGLSEKQIKKVFETYEEQYIREKIDVIQSSTSFKDGKVKNLARYFLSALHDDYQPSQRKKYEAMRPKEHAHNQSDIEMQTQFRRFQEDELFNKVNNLPQQEKRKLMNKFEKFLMGIYQQLYLREGLKNILIQEQLGSFLRKINHELIDQLPSYQQWLKTK